MQITTDTFAFTELDYRESHGIEVSLLWSPDDPRLTVYVSDNATNESFELAVAADEVREAFDHPFAYAASRRVCSSLEQCAAPKREGAAPAIAVS